MTHQIGYALIGTADSAAMAAFAEVATISRLVAVVSGDAKTQALAEERGVAVYRQDEFRECLQRDDVNAVYLALPTSMRGDATVEAARARVHVLCERPMAVTADECRRMLRACHTNHVRLLVAYRLHFHSAHRKLLELVRGGAIGAVKTFGSDFSVRVENREDFRRQRRLGGGTLYDLGVSCINTARHVLEAEPAQVMAMTARANSRFGGDVDEATVALIRFPDDRLAHFHTSFGEEQSAMLTVFGEDGLIRLANAYHAHAPAILEVVRGGAREELRFEPADQLAAEIEYFSRCILDSRTPEPSGLDGLRDVRIVEAIYRSARDGRPVTLPRPEISSRVPPDRHATLGEGHDRSASR
jgi:glucose-fructose oxidoreductase